MKYMLLFYENEEAMASRSNAKSQEYWGAWSAYIQALQGAGIVLSGEGLQLPGTSTTVRLKSGKQHVQDGPFIDSKEQLGGYFLIDVPNLDQALSWASRSPAASSGAVEVRPALVM